jgi:hypothetical protein
MLCGGSRPGPADGMHYRILLLLFFSFEQHLIGLLAPSGLEPTILRDPQYELASI